MIKYLLISIIIVVFFLTWIFASLKKYNIRFFPLLLLEISSFSQLSFYNIPIYFLSSIIFVGSYLILPILSLKKYRNNYIKDKKIRWSYPIIIEILYFTYLFFYLFSTLFGEYTFHYSNSVLYCTFVIIVSIFILDFLKRDKEAILFLLYGIFLFGIIISILIYIIYFTTVGTPFVRSMTEYRIFENTFGPAGHYGICIMGIISGLTLLSFELEIFEKYKNVKRKFNKKKLLIFLGVIFIFFAIVLTGGRFGLIISFLLLMSYFWYFLKRNSRKFGIKVIIIIFLVFFSCLFLFQNNSNIIRMYSGRFSNLSSNNYMEIIFGKSRADANRVILENSTINLLGRGRGITSSITGKYFNFGAHNFYLETLFDAGIFALIMYILIILFILFLGLRKKGYFGVNIFGIGIFLLVYSFYGGFGSHIFLTFLIGLSIGIYNISFRNQN